MIKETGIDKIQQAFKKLPTETATAMRKAMKTAVSNIQQEAKNNSGYIPRSGNLDRLITSPSLVKVDNSGLVATLTLQNSKNVPYAIIQHEGGSSGRKKSSKITAKKFIERAIEAKERDTMRILETAIMEAVERVGL